MNIKTEFTEPECERFRRECNFTEEELAVFNLRVKNFSVVEIQQRLNGQGLMLAESTIWRRLKSIREKIRKIT